MHHYSMSRLALIPALAFTCWVVAVTAPQDLQAQAGLRERTIFVSALNSRGEVVEGLGISDFVVTEDGRRREVLRVSPALEPIDIAVLVDNSATSIKAIPSIRDGLRDFATQMAVGNQIALVALADRPTIFVDYTSSPERFGQGIGRLIPIITNGTEFTNRYARDVVGAVRQAGASLHAIVIGNLTLGTTEERERAFTLDEGTRTTGGQHVTLFAETAVEQALLKLARELTGQYKVVYGRPESLIPPEKVEVASARTGVTMRGTPARGQTGA
jgi:hypothetical protein